MYSITRAEAAEILNISTRSLDRHIKAGKIRAKKDGKIVYVNKEDIDNMSGKSVNNQAKIIIANETIMGNKENKDTVNKQVNTPNQESSIVKKSDVDKINATFEKVFNSLKDEIKQKDEKITNLSKELGKAEEVINNSISLVEHKKSQFLIEESKGHLNREVTDITNERNKLLNELKYEKTTNKLLITFVIILLVVAGAIWFITI